MNHLKLLLPLLLATSLTPATAQSPAPAPAAATLPATPDTYNLLAAQVEASLKRDVADAWFPRAVDRERGGFHQNFSASWEKEPSDERSIVYQARLTWLAAQLAERYPERRVEFVGYARHGMRFLADVMWDRQAGGFFWSLGAKNVPTSEREDEKHLYGNAFAIYALSAAHHATGDRAALELAQRGFRWIDAHAHDARNGGYFEALTRAGKPILAPRGQKNPDGSEIKSDAIGTRLGFKSMNTHIHLLEAFTALYERWPNDTLRRRLVELHRLVRDKITVPSVGAMHLYFLPNWTAVPDHDSYGHDVETAFLLVESAEALGMHGDEATWGVARRLVDHALEAGWDAENGGFYDAGPIYGSPFKDEKVWWVQAEGLNALLLMHERFGAGEPKYFEAFQKQWEFISRRQIDAQHPGWHATVSRDGSTVASTSKSNAWTEGYHQGRALLHVSAGLRALAIGRGQN